MYKSIFLILLICRAVTLEVFGIIFEVESLPEHTFGFVDYSKK